MNRATKNKRKKNKKKNKNYINKNENQSNKNENNIESIENNNLEEDKKFEPLVDISLGNNGLDRFNNMPRITLKFGDNDYELEDSKPLKLMEKVNEDDLLLNSINYDCFILLEITSITLRMVSLQFYANDENNNKMLISVYNYQGIFTVNSFKQGYYIIIKEPNYKQYLNGEIGIKVDNPNNIILFESKEKANEYIKKEKQ